MDCKFRSLLIGTLALTGLGLVATSFVPTAHADAWDKKTFVTVNEPIIAGNKVLDPGTYVWKLLDSQSDRHIVQIFDKDQRHLEETILAIPNYRLEPTGKTQFAFWETPAGVPKAVRAWFYPGDNFGQEFAYPRKLVAQLASAAPVPVPMNYAQAEPAPAENAPAAEAAPETQPAPAAAPAPEPEVQQPQQNTTVAQVPVPQKTLPHTASFSPLIGLLGLASLSLSGLITILTKRA